jgi:hypothetical protein
VADYRQGIYQSLIARGLNPEQARGAIISLMGESGQTLSPKSFNPNDPGGAMGFAQWVGSRRAGLQAVARSMGTSETDPNAQLAYFNQEIAPGGPKAWVIDSIKNNARTAADATGIWTRGYEAPAKDNSAQRFAGNQNAITVGEDGSPVFSITGGPGRSLAGTTLTSVPRPPHTLTPPTAGAPYTPEAVVAANPPAAVQPPQNVGDWLKKIATKPVTKDAQGNEVQGKSPLESIAGSFAKPAGSEAPSIPSMPVMQPVQDPTMQLAGPSQQLFSAVSAAAAKPLSWSSTPYGSGAGQLGTTLNATGYGYG